MLAAGDAHGRKARRKLRRFAGSGRRRSSLFVPLLALGLYLQVSRPNLPAAPFADRGAEHPRPNSSMSLACWPKARASGSRDPNDADALAALGEGLTLEAGGTAHSPRLEALRLRLADAARRCAHPLLSRPARGAGGRLQGRNSARWRDLEAKSPPDAPYLADCCVPRSRAAGEGRRHRGAESASLGTDHPCRNPAASSRRRWRSSRPSSASRRSARWSKGWRTRLADNPQDRAGWLRLANAWKVLGDNQSRSTPTAAPTR